MAKYPPKEGEIWVHNEKRFRIKGINPQTNEIIVDKIEEDGSFTTAKDISKKQWIRRDYVLETTIENGNWFVDGKDTGQKAQGPKGEKGDAVVSSAPAQKTIPGPKGEKGDKGEAGPRGPKGDMGIAGPQGPKGEKGEAGPRGPKGDRGLSGPPEKVNVFWRLLTLLAIILVGVLGYFVWQQRERINRMPPTIDKSLLVGEDNLKKDADNYIFEVAGVSFKMIYVEGGSFTMGKEDGTTESLQAFDIPAHEVTLSDFYIGETEVTQELWQAVMGNTPSHYSGQELPVEEVSWKDCQHFIEQLKEVTGRNFRLPTEAEWEFAAKGGIHSQNTMFSGSQNVDEVAWHGYNSNDKPHSVKTKMPNELGLYDMSGNVFEWCSDWLGAYSDKPQSNPTGPSSGPGHVRRGGSCMKHAESCSVTYRGAPSMYIPDLKNPDMKYIEALDDSDLGTGLRLVLSK